MRPRKPLDGRMIADVMEKLPILENAVVGEQAAVIAAAGKMRQGWDFAGALHHALAGGCDDFTTFDTNLARRASRDVWTAPPVIAI